MARRGSNTKSGRDQSLSSAETPGHGPGSTGEVGKLVKMSSKDTAHVALQDSPEIVVRSVGDADPVAARGRAALSDVRGSFAVVMGAIGGVTRAVQLAEKLKLDRSLAWKVWRTAYGPDALPSAKHIPGEAGVAMFLSAAERAGATAASIAKARRAFAAFREFASEQAPDRASADILLGSLSMEGRRRMELALRRDGFRANSHVLGVHTQTLFQMDIVTDPKPGTMPDIVRLRAHQGLRRLREGASWVVSRSTLLQSKGPAQHYARLPLCDESGVGAKELGVPLLPQFCSTPVPPVSREWLSNGAVVDEVGPGPIGEAASMDIVTGERVTNIPYDMVTRDAVTMHVRTPSEALCFDIVLPARLAALGETRLDAYTLINGDFPFTEEAKKRDVIPMDEPLRALGVAAHAPPPAEVSRHAEMLGWLADRVGIDLEKFVLFRVVVKHPPIPICLAVHYPLPGAG
jgi:hypothetical protein